MRKLVWLPFLFLVSSIQEIRAQADRYQFARLSISDGLSHNLVKCILKDQRGFMWFGTMSGLNRYDGYGFRVFKHNRRDTSSLNDDNVMNIQAGPHGKLWVQTRTGYVIYDPQKENFDRRPGRFLEKIGVSGQLSDIRGDGRGTFWLITSAGVYKYREQAEKARLLWRTASSAPATSLAISRDGNVWVIHRDGLIIVAEAQTNKLLKRIKVAAEPEKAVYRIFTDADNDAWIYSADRPLGVFYINRGGEREHYTTDPGLFRLSTNNIYSISQDRRGIIWIGTDHGGINLIDKGGKTVQLLLSRESDEKSLAQNSTPVIYTDNTGTVWVGTFKQGVSYYHEGMIRFPLYSHWPGDAGSLPYEDVNRFAEDHNGNLWIGTNGGGLIYFDRRQNQFKRFRHQPDQQNSLANDVVVSLWIDRHRKLWIGTYFGGLDCFDGKQFTHYRNSRTDPKSLSDDRVWELFEDSGGYLWVGTLAGGINVFDADRRLVRQLRAGPGTSTIKSNYIAALEEDSSGNIWIGTDRGIDIWVKKSGRFKHFAHSERDGGSLSNDNVMSLLKDSRGWMWVGTQEGLNIYKPANNYFEIVSVQNGLADNTVLTILEDRNGNIWTSTPRGLSNIIIGKEGSLNSFTIRNYDKTDGLQGWQFNENAALSTRQGELIFGGANGFNIFRPGNIGTNRDAPEVVLTGFQLFNQDIRPGQLFFGKKILEHSVTESREVTLDYDQNVFSVEFAALNYSNAPKNKYAYILEGFNDKWLTTDSKNRKATFTNLDPGDYIFRVKASNDSGIWNNTGASLKIKILPPFWKTPLAYCIYAVCLFLILIFIRHRAIRKLREQFVLEQEREEARRMHELDMMKIKFFTNVSHEFRTPLSLILSPLDNLLRTTVSTADKHHLMMIRRNASRLLNLVNQLMDFRRMEVNELRLHPEEGDIVAFARESFESFTDLAEKKGIDFSFCPDAGSYTVHFDHDKIGRILFNLLSNAFKFTPDGGSVKLDMKVVEKQGDSVLVILVKDSGIGIPRDKQEKIFERFFQHDIPGSLVNQGSGIGLAITREFVNLHGGTIRVESEQDKGSCFIVELPFGTVVKTDAGTPATAMVPPSLILPEHAHADESKEAVPSGAGYKKRRVLLIEDNEDFRFYLKENLRHYYILSEAADGKEGWSRALAEQPDLIVSDISMPEMSGIDLCRKIRQDKRTMHIPIILLTAMTGEEMLLRGLGIGANDYMTKPFNFEVLTSKIRNLCEQQDSMRKTYQRQIDAVPTEAGVIPADEKFIRQALAIVEKNIANTGFSVEELSREMAMSRVALYKKLLQLTRQTPVGFIRTIRLKRASQLLEKSQLTVSEVAYQTGFNNPKVFAKYFKTEFGVLPSVWAKKGH